MDRKPLSPPSIGRMGHAGNSEPGPIVDVEGQLRALLTLGGGASGDVFESTRTASPEDYFSARHGYGQSRQQEHRYEPFRPTSTLPPQTRRVSSFAQLQSYDEQFKTILTERLSDLFHDSAHTTRPAEEVPLQDWLRAAIWWAVQGKSALEVQQQQGTETEAEQDEDQQPALQGLVNLAKAWWICHHIVTQDTFRIRMAAYRMKGTPDSALFEQYRAVLVYLRGYERRMAAALCAETGLPPGIDLDRRLWISYTTLGLYNGTILDNSRGQAWDLPPMAFGDTGDLFCYSSVVVEATLVDQGDSSLPTSTFQCIFSIMRDRESWQAVGVIASQVQLLHTTIQSERSQGPVWKDIEWDVARHAMLIRLHHSETLLRIRLSEDSFASIWTLAHDIIATETDMVAGEDESLLFDDTVKSCQYINRDKPVGFPAKPVPHCRVRLLKKLTAVTYGTGKRKVHGGLRIIIATPPHTKTRHRVTHDLPNSCPLAYSLVDGENGSPRILLHLAEKDKDETCSLFIYFEDPEARTLLHSLLLDSTPLRGESNAQSFLISSYAIDMQSQGSETQATKNLDSGESQALVIEEEAERESRGTHYGKTILSEHLRVIIQNDWGSITDRLNIGPGQLAIALPIHENTTVHFHRLPQDDLSMAVAHDLVGKDHLAKIRCLLQSIQTKPSIRIVKFKTQADLHRFQEAVTGFSVRFDGLATRFLITRRRKLLPLLKQWDTNLARIQLIQRGGRSQIIAFFHAFRHWKCLNFEVTALDETEKMDQKGECGVRIRDAKYALPPSELAGGSGDHDRGLPTSVCLDELDFPTEHSDVAIMFGDAVARDTFAECLPGLTA
ncbi:hypothetical protein BJY00DRAFT_323091 [Aspergillus carlsbadensis]|nr:hypothetical protein BJY00DRAFT_323091 [Aspergillus carlsbadensis]